MIAGRGGKALRHFGGRTLFCLGVSAVAFGTTPAIANPSVGATVSAEGGYSTRARGGGGGSQSRGSAHAQLEFRPYLTYELPRTTINASGSVRHSQYFSGSEDTTDYTARLAVASKLSPRANLRLGASLSRANVNNILLRPNEVTVPDDPELPPVIDPTIIADQNATRTSFRGDAGLGLVLSPRDQLNISGSAGGVRYSRLTTTGPGRLREYDSYQGSLGYQRAVNASLSVGAQFSVSRNDYIGGTFGDSTQYSPAATASISLDPRWRLNANVGATFVRGTNALGRVNNSGLSGGASLCRKGDLSRLCVTGNYGYSPSSVNGVARTLSLGGDYSSKLSERTSFNVRAGYSRASEVQTFGSRKFDQFSAGGGVSHQLTRRLSIFGSASYATVNDNLTQRPDNVSIGAGLRLSLGESR